MTILLTAKLNIGFRESGDNTKRRAAGPGGLEGRVAK